MCGPQLRSLVNSNPRYVCWSAWVSSSPDIKYWWNRGCFFCVILRTEHFFGLKDISHLWDHSTTVSRSCCNPSASSFPPICRNRIQSSANNFMLEFTPSPMSLIYSKKSNGPSTVPWGTPEATWTSDDALHPLQLFAYGWLTSYEPTLVWYQWCHNTQVCKAAVDVAQCQMP